MNGSNRASWRGEVGNPTRQLVLNARAADLIVLGSPTPDLVVDRHRTVDAGRVIVSVGRPVLVAPRSLRPINAQSVLIAWNDTREVRRAVVDALPFLTKAKDVVVAMVGNGDMDARASVEDVESFLKKHGVQARSELMRADYSEPAEVVLQTAQQMGADLIVLGGYGHSRARESTFGGVTRSVLCAGSFHRFISN